MKGLRKYIKKHGKHFTEELAISITSGRISPFEVMEMAQNIVYYNVTGSTDGDIVFLANHAKDCGNSSCRSKYRCVKAALGIVGEYSFSGGATFDSWLVNNKDFDFTPYI